LRRQVKRRFEDQDDASYGIRLNGSFGQFPPAAKPRRSRVVDAVADRVFWPSRDEPEPGPARQSTFLLTNRRASATVFQNRPDKAGSRVSWAGATGLWRRCEAKRGVKSLKTNNSAKCPDFAPQ
jgi:hypothetical protein